jgi:PAP2 superfamily
MDSRLRRLQARILPHGPLDALRQVALFGAVYLVYRIVRGLVEGQATSAFRHAYDLIHIEQGLHLFVEPSIQAWASGSRLLMDVSSWMYVNAQTTVTVGALVYLYLCRNRSFYFVRNMFMIAMGIALVAYAFFPTAPPRFIPEWGFFDPVEHDTGMRLATGHGGGGGVTTALTNLYAAVPSMHVAFALMIGWPLARLVRPRPLRLLWAAYPLLMTFVIIATANHFILDALLGALTAAVSAYGARRLAHVRPAAWRFSPARLEAEAPA